MVFIMLSSSCRIKILSALLLCCSMIIMVLVQMLLTASPIDLNNRDLDNDSYLFPVLPPNDAPPPPPPLIPYENDAEEDDDYSFQSQDEDQGTTIPRNLDDETRFQNEYEKNETDKLENGGNDENNGNDEIQFQNENKNNETENGREYDENGNDISYDTTFDFIFGYSSSGKSTYVNQTYGLDNVILGYFKNLGFRSEMTERELFLQFDKWIKNAAQPGKSQHIVIHINIFLLAETPNYYVKLVRTMLSYPAKIRAIGLVINQESLLVNIQNRTTVEKGEGSYSRVKNPLLNMAKDIDQPGFFRFFIEEFLLLNNDIEINYIESKPNFEFKPLPDLESALSILSSEAASKSDVQEFYNKRKNSIQPYSMPLPYNTKIENRYDYEGSKDKIFKNLNIVNKSILDINSPFAYFALEASKAGAAVARALEGHIQSELGVRLKTLWGIQNVEILRLHIFDTIWKTPFVQNRYDIVFLMNNLYKSSDPIRLLRIAVSLAKDALVIELVSPSPKSKYDVADKTPMIIYEKKRFGINLAAIKSVLASDCTSFKKILSSIPWRTIIICFKTES